MSYIVIYEWQRWEWISDYWYLESLNELPQKIANHASWQVHAVGRESNELQKMIHITGIYEATEIPKELDSIYTQAQAAFEANEAKHRTESDALQRLHDEQELNRLKAKLGRVQ